MKTIVFKEKSKIKPEDLIYTCNTMILSWNNFHNKYFLIKSYKGVLFLQDKNNNFIGENRKKQSKSFLFPT